MTAPTPTPAPLFVRPRIGWFLVLDGGLVLTAVLACNEKAYEKVSASVPLPERSELQKLAAGALGLHLFEASVGRRMARRRGLSPQVVRKWTRQTFVVGFPSLLALRKIAPAPPPA